MYSITTSAFGTFEWTILSVLDDTDRPLTVWEIEQRVYGRHQGGPPVYRTVGDELEGLVLQGLVVSDDRALFSLTDEGNKTLELAIAAARSIQEAQ